MMREALTKYIERVRAILNAAEEHQDAPIFGLGLMNDLDQARAEYMAARAKAIEFVSSQHKD